VVPPCYTWRHHASGKEIGIFYRLPVFGLFLAFFLQILQLKNVLQKSKCVHHPVLDATFVPNLTFLGLLSPEISFGEKQSATHPAYFAIREPQ